MQSYDIFENTEIYKVRTLKIWSRNWRPVNEQAQIHPFGFDYLVGNLEQLGREGGTGPGKW
jgi:hypothetical protein